MLCVGIKILRIIMVNRCLDSATYRLYCRSNIVDFLYREVIKANCDQQCLFREKVLLQRYITHM